MAEYSASLYAKTASEKAHYLDYYRNYYKTGGGGDPNAAGAGTAKKPLPPANAAPAPVNTSDNDTVTKKKDLGKVMVSGVEYPRYPTPDVSTYTFDDASGYYYDGATQLYYDANSQYYFDSKANKYVYWSPEHHTFLPAPDESTTSTTKAEDEKKKDEKKDKVKTAKRIAKDMEKWAKTLNQKKDAAKSALSQPLQQQVQVSKSTEDVAFSILQNRDENNEGLARLSGYGSDSAEEDNSNSAANSANSAANTIEEQQFTDWSKLACLLCKRQFPSRDKLTKHNEKSDLHRSNLESWRNEQTESASGSSMLGGSGYRDRAKERRQKYGLDDEGPRPNKLKEKYLAAMEESANQETATNQKTKKLDSSNIGSKMLQKMGWKEGLGLGKTNQGRTSIIEAEGNRNSQAGLGSSGGGAAAKANPNESYKDSVKRT